MQPARAVHHVTYLLVIANRSRRLQQQQQQRRSPRTIIDGIVAADKREISAPRASHACKLLFHSSRKNSIELRSTMGFCAHVGEVNVSLIVRLAARSLGCLTGGFRVPRDACMAAKASRAQSNSSSSSNAIIIAHRTMIEQVRYATLARTNMQQQVCLMTL